MFAVRPFGRRPSDRPDSSGFSPRPYRTTRRHHRSRDSEPEFWSPPDTRPIRPRSHEERESHWCPIRASATRGTRFHPIEVRSFPRGTRVPPVLTGVELFATWHDRRRESSREGLQEQELASYLSPMIDCFDGMVVSWSIGTRPDAELVNTMLDAAIESVSSTSERPLVHSDRGPHYRWPGELFYPRNWQCASIEQFIQAVDSYIRWYNHSRIRISLGALSPVEYPGASGCRLNQSKNSAAPLSSLASARPSPRRHSVHELQSSRTQRCATLTLQCVCSAHWPSCDHAFARCARCADAVKWFRDHHSIASKAWPARSLSVPRQRRSCKDTTLFISTNFESTSCHFNPWRS